MKYRLKVRITRASGKSSKVSFEVDDAATYVVQADTPGFDGLGETGELFKLSVADGVFWLLRESGGRLVVTPGMIVPLAEGHVEFLEAPLEQAQVVDIEPSAQPGNDYKPITAQRPCSTASVSWTAAALSLTKGGAAPTPELEQARDPELEAEPALAPRPDPVIFTPDPSKAFTKPETVLDAKTGSIEIEMDPPGTTVEQTIENWYVGQSAPGLATESTKHPRAINIYEPVGKHARKKHAGRVSDTKGSWLAIAAALAVIAAFGELGAWVIARVNPEIGAIRPGMGAGLAILSSCLIAGITRIASSGSVLVSLAWGAALLPLWAASFAFPTPVELPAAVAAALVWAVIFFVRARPSRILKLVPVATMLAVSLMSTGHWLRSASGTVGSLPLDFAGWKAKLLPEQAHTPESEPLREPATAVDAVQAPLAPEAAAHPEWQPDPEVNDMMLRLRALSRPRTSRRR